MMRGVRNGNRNEISNLRIENFTSKKKNMSTNKTTQQQMSSYGGSYGGSSSYGHGSSGGGGGGGYDRDCKYLIFRYRCMFFFLSRSFVFCFVFFCFDQIVFQSKRSFARSLWRRRRRKMIYSRSRSLSFSYCALSLRRAMRARVSACVAHTKKKATNFAVRSSFLFSFSVYFADC